MGLDAPGAEFSSFLAGTAGACNDEALRLQAAGER